MNVISSKILDISAYFPENVLDNQELANLYPDWSATKIFEKTGIQQRRIAGDEQTAGDLALGAAQALFAQGKVSADQVDFLILCTQAQDYILPSTACVLQDKLGIGQHAGAFDINLGCSGYVYGLGLAKSLIETGLAQCVLLLTADTYSKYIHPMDKSVRTIFGDAASATAIVADKEGRDYLGPFVFGTDGSGAKNLIVEAGLFRFPKNKSTSIEATDNSGNVRTSENLYMNGAEVLNFSLRVVPALVDDLLRKSNLKKEQIDFFVFHQANKFMLNTLRKKLALPQEKVPTFLELCGNTVSSTIPLTLRDMFLQGTLSREQKLMLVGFGVGYSWAGCLITT